MVLAGIKVPDTTLVRDAIELSRSSLEPYLFNHVMRSWLFGVLLSEAAELTPDPELLAVSAFIPQLPVEAFAVAVLPRTAGLDVQRSCSHLRQPLSELLRHELRAVV